MRPEPSDLLRPTGSAVPVRVLERADRDGSAATADWVGAYLRARGREGRLYPDEVVAALPAMPDRGELGDEWRRRAESSARLVAYLRQRRGAVSVLELGCGNGWLAHRLAEIPGTSVVGVDANALELAQAGRVFRAPNLRFVHADILDMAQPVDRPDIIVLASVVQYVPALASLVGRLRTWLAPGGEIHILDSPFYRPLELKKARERTRRHYERIGVPEMAHVYRHHPWSAIEGVGFEFLYRPDGLRARIERRLLGRTKSPFPWIRIPATRAR